MQVEKEVMNYSKEIKAIAIGSIALTANVRHAHLWETEGYSPLSITNYNEKDIIKMAITIVDNIEKGMQPFDNEPVVWYNEGTDLYEVQTGNTRAITLIVLSGWVDSFDKVEGLNFLAEHVEISDEVKDKLSAMWKEDLVNFAVISRKLTDGEKRRENTVRSQQHWMATAEGFYLDNKAGTTIKKIAQTEGISVKKVSEMKSCAQNLIPEAKKLVFENKIKMKPAIKLATLNPEVQAKIVERIEDREAVVEKANEIDNFLRWTFQVIGDNYPTFYFKDLTLKVHPRIDEEPWFMKIEDGMFTTFYATDKEAYEERLNAYLELKAHEYKQQYPNLKEIENEWNIRGKVTKELECASAVPILVSGKYLKFQCNDDLCPVHGVYTKQGVIDEIEAKVKSKSWKETFTDSITEASSKNHFGSVCLRLLWLKTMFNTLRSDAKEEFLTWLDERLQEYETYSGKETKGWWFDFTTAVTGGEDFVALRRFVVDDTKNALEHKMAFLNMADNAHNKEFAKAFFAEIEVDIRDHFDEDAYNQKRERMIKSKLKKSKRALEVMNFAKYNLQLPVLDDDHIMCGYIPVFGHRYELNKSIDIQTLELKIEGVTKKQFYKAFLNKLGVDKVGKMDIEEMKMNIVRKMDELTPLVGKHEDESYKHAINVYDTNKVLVDAIRDLAKKAAIEDYTSPLAIPFNTFLNGSVITKINETYGDRLKAPMKIAYETGVYGPLQKAIDKNKLTTEIVVEGTLKTISEDFVFRSLKVTPMPEAPANQEEEE